MLFLEATLIVITALLFIVGVMSKRKTLVRWGIGSLILLIVLFTPSFVNGFVDGLSSGWSAK